MKQKSVRILHLEDDANDAELVRNILLSHQIDPDVQRVSTQAEYIEALDRGEMDLILSDSGVPGFEGVNALEIARAMRPQVPFIFVSGNVQPGTAERLSAAGAAACVSKVQLWQVVAAVERALADLAEDAEATIDPARPAELLVAAVQELSLARDLDTIMTVVRRAARELTNADGATFVLRDGDQCHYADENAIAPLWKGKRFPMSACISGWAMLHRQPAVIEDIYNDTRVPVAAYRPTFVKSLAMVPIRTSAPIGAIGNYWARRHRATPQELRLLQALADSTSIAIENVQLYTELERRVALRTAQLETSNRELESFAYAVSHDLRAPLRHIEGFGQILLRGWSQKLDAGGREHLERILDATEHMGQLINDLLELSRTTRAPVRRQPVDLSALAREIAAELQVMAPERSVEFVIADGLLAEVDPGLMRAALQNLVGNAWKFTAKRADARIEFGCTRQADQPSEYYISDNGAGFEMAYAKKLFTPFQRLHSTDEFPGTGVGLATVRRIIDKHGGSISAEAEPGVGATFRFTLG